VSGPGDYPIPDQPRAFKGRAPHRSSGDPGGERRRVEPQRGRVALPAHAAISLSGKLPAGLKLSSSGVISGKATTAGTLKFVVKVVDTKTAVTPQTSATKSLSITIK
jgi:hypothetical protein